MRYLDDRQPQVLAAGEAMQQQYGRCVAPWCSAAGITEAITSTVGVADRQPEPETAVPGEDCSRIIVGSPMCLQNLFAIAYCALKINSNSKV